MTSQFEKSHLKHLHEYLIWYKKMLKDELKEKPRNRKTITKLRSVIERTQKDIRHFKQILRKKRR